jgi:hypothetical protein
VPEKWKPRIHEKWLGILIAAAEFSHTMDFAHNYPELRFRIHTEINPTLVDEDETNIGGPLAPSMMEVECLFVGFGFLYWHIRTYEKLLGVVALIWFCLVIWFVLFFDLLFFFIVVCCCCCCCCCCCRWWWGWCLCGNSIASHLLVHLCSYEGRTIVSKRYPFRPPTYNHMAEFIKEVTLLAYGK